MDEQNQPTEAEQPTPGRFALYDKTLLRFAGAVRDSKSAAHDDRPENAERGRYEVREV